MRANQKSFLMAQPLTLKQLGSVHSVIWKYIRTPDNSPHLAPKLIPRVKYTPRAAGGLASQHLMYVVLQDTVKSPIRYLKATGLNMFAKRCEVSVSTRLALHCRTRL